LLIKICKFHFSQYKRHEDISVLLEVTCWHCIFLVYLRLVCWRGISSERRETHCQFATSISVQSKSAGHRRAVNHSMLNSLDTYHTNQGHFDASTQGVQACATPVPACLPPQHRRGRSCAFTYMQIIPKLLRIFFVEKAMIELPSSVVVGDRCCRFLSIGDRKHFYSFGLS
jgi:hypothetical protein